VPVCAIGFFAHDLVATHLRHPLVIAATTILFGVVLWLTDYYGVRKRETKSLTWRDVAVIGFAQCLALIPGTSRSGITMSAALALGFSRSAAARYSFLLSIPVIVIATGFETLTLVGTRAAVDWIGLTVVAAVAAISAFVCIAVFLRLLERVGMAPFVIYRLVLGALLVVLHV
jgi:undecaprenyl-diphosphatase